MSIPELILKVGYESEMGGSNFKPNSTGFFFIKSRRQRKTLSETDAAQA